MRIRQSFINFKTGLVILLVSLYSVICRSQIPTYKLFLTNENQVSPNDYEFDVYLLRTSAATFELSGIQFGLAFDTSIANGGTLSASIVPGYSQLPPNYTSGNVIIGVMNYNVGGIICKYFNAAAGTIPSGGPGSGFLVPDVNNGCASPGVRVARYRISNTQTFRPNSSCKHTWSTGPGSQRTNTTVSAYVGSTNTIITDYSNHLTYTDTGTCITNVVLNPSNPCAVFVGTTTTSASCFGVNDGSANINLTGAGSASTGTYSIDGGATVAFSSNPFLINNLSAGSHTLTIQTSTPCSAGPVNFVIGGPTSPGSSSQTVSACDSYTWSVDGNTYTSSGTYTFNGTQGGCPHTYTLNLTVNSSTIANSTRTECNTYTWPVNGTTYSNSGIYTFNGTNAAGCPLTSTLNLTISNVSVNATPSGVLNCFDSMTPVQVNATGGVSPYTGTGTFNQGSGTITYNVTDDNGCMGSAIVSLTAPSRISGVVTTTPANCGASDGTATVSPGGGTGPYTYLWSNGQTGISASGLSSGSHSLNITDDNGCVETINFNVAGSGGQPDPAGPISGPPGTCVNQSGLVYSIAPIANAVSYVWTLPTGVSGTSTTNSITLTVGPTYAGGFICVAPVNSCGQGIQSCYNIPLITLRPSQPGLINGDDKPCGPNVYTYSIPSISNALSYTWSVSGSGATIINGQGTRTIEVSIPAGFSQGSVSVKAQNCIGSTATRTLQLTGIPAHTNNLIGQAFVCPGSQAIPYSIGAVAGATSYTWTASGSMQILSSVQGSCLVDFGSGFTSGVLTVTTNGACGNFSKSFTIRSTPFQPRMISGPGTDLCSLSNITYSINAVLGASSYSWTVPAGVNIIANTGLSITVNFTSAFSGTGYICAKALNACGNSAARCFTISSRPEAPGEIVGEYNPCRSATETYSIAPVSGASGYLWSVSGGATITSAGTSATVNYNSMNVPTAVLTVKASNACGEGMASRKNILVNLLCRQFKVTPAEHQEASLFPNPASKRTLLKFHSASDQFCTTYISDVSGRVIYRNTIHSVEGSNLLDLDISYFKPGLYIISVEHEDGIMQSDRLIVQ